MVKAAREPMKKPIKITLGIVIGIIAIVIMYFAVTILTLIYQQSLVPEVKDKGIKVACVGDSITFGQGVIFSRSTNSYPAQLQKMLGDDYQVLNYGAMSKTLADTGKSPYTQFKFYKYSRESNPDIVLIMLGTNDSWQKNWNADVYEKQLEGFVNVYKNLPSKPKVYLMTPCDAFAVANPNIIKNEIVPIIYRVGKKVDTQVIDIFAATKDRRDYFTNDGVHPNTEGNKVIAEMVYKAFKQ